VTERLASETIVDGRYRVLGRLGSGGMADVYCAEDLQLGRNVALKVLHSRFAADSEFRERFRREARSAAGLQHQNVVSIYDRGEWDGNYYIAMEYLDGRSLKEIVSRDGPLAPERAIDLTIQVLRAVRFAHRRGIIHRDIKPHNVIVDEEDRAKVTDFGIARAAGASDMTQTGSIMGTAQYLSPEQAQGHAVSEPSDLYSAGIMLYELLTGRLPFDGESAVTIALKHVNERPVPPSMINPAVPPELEGVVMRALEKDPRMRFPDADAFIAALEHARVARPGTVVEEAVVYSPPPPPYEEVYEEEAAGRRWWLWLIALGLILAIAGGAYYLLAGNGAGTKQVPVPDVVGTDEAAAVTALHNAGFATDVVQKTSAERPEGTVISTDPAGGTEADKGSTVRVNVSSGPGTAPVPSVSGLSRDEARSRLKRAGFKIEERRESSDKVPAGKAIRTSPPAQTRLEKGSQVILLLSTGVEQVEVPDVTGQQFASAAKELQDRGFKVQRNDQVTDNEDPGTVLKQSPGANQKIDKGSTVTLAVAKEPQQVEVTDVTGETQDAAVQRLTKDGLEVEIVEQAVPTQEDDGHVIAQNPQSGKVKRGSTVTLTVAKFDPAAAGQTTTTTPGTPTTTTTTP
jgi:eukaryotic-like serine/threonine-protein kinase